MSNGLRSSSDEFLKILDPFREQEKPKFIEDVTSGTTGNPLMDFVGQAAWKFTDEAFVGSLGVSDAISESIKGDAANTWEETIARGAAGDWEELSDAGKAGAMVGGALGQIPAFVIGGQLTKGLLHGLTKGGRALNLAVKKSVPELIEAGEKIAVKKGVDIAKSLTDDTARTIIDDAYDIASGAGDLAKLEGKISQEIYEASLNAGIKANIRQTLQIADEELLEGISRETVKIVSRNNPDNAEALMTMMVSRVPGLRDKPKASLVLGAMAYDATIGLVLGSMRAATQEVQASNWNVRRDQYGEYQDIGLYNFDAGRFLGELKNQALYDAFLFAPFGAVKNINPRFFGGKSTDASHGKRLANIIQKSFSAFRPLKKMTNKQLRMQLTAMDELAGGTLTREAGEKFTKMSGQNGNRQWWLDATTKNDTDLMREMLSKIRRKFVINAVPSWTAEFGVDMFRSLPRMAAGVAAMNGPIMAKAFWDHGFTEEAFNNSLGESPAEKAANVFTAMYFTRKPHSFNIEATPGIFNKIFETGKIESYRNAKLSKLRKIVGGLNTFGADQAGLQRIIMNYGHYDIRQGKDGEADVIIKKTLDSSPEFNEVKNIFSPYSGRTRTGTTDLHTAFNKHIADMVKNGTLTYEESLPLYEKLLVADKIINVYNKNTSEKINVDSYTPQEAFDIVNKVSTVKFDGQFIGKNDPDSQIESWMEKIVEKSIEIPTNILKEHMIKTYEALGITIDADTDGPLKLPSIKHLDFGDSTVDETLSYLWNIGIKNNWIEQGTPLTVDQSRITGEHQRKVREVFDNSSDRMMSLVWGDNWKTKHNMDDQILINDVWALTHNDLLLRSQRRNAYELLTGGDDHNIAAGDARNVLDAVNRHLLTTKRPKVKKGDREAEDYGEVDAFIGTLHKTISALNPDTHKNPPVDMTQEEARSLMELFKDTTGNLFTDGELSKDFENYITQKSMSRLGINDMNTGVDSKAGLYTLMQDPTMNYQGEGTKTILPTLDRVKSTLKALEAADLRGQTPEDQVRIRETYKELLTHYENISNAVGDSKFPLEFRDDLVEQSSGDWKKSITKSLANGLMVMDDFANDRAMRASSLLGSQEARFDMLIEQIELGASVIDTDNRDKYNRDLQDLMDSRTVTQDLKNTIKRAIMDKDPYILRAVSKNEGSLKNAIDALSTDPFSDKAKYRKELLEIQESIINNAHFQALNESTIGDFVRNEMAGYSIPAKDVQERVLRITTSQFANKYRMSVRDIDSIFNIERSSQMEAREIRAFAESILGDFYTNPSGVMNTTLQNRLNTIVNTLNRFSGQVPLNAENFKSFVTDPLRMKMEIEAQDISGISDVDIDTDLYAIASTYFSKRPIKTVKVDLSTNTLVQGYKPVGETRNRGITAIINALDPMQNNIYLAESKGIDGKGNVIREINGFPLDQINSSIGGGNFSIESPSGVSEFYKHNDTTRMSDVNRQPSNQGEKFKAIPINWNTTLIVRMDKYDGGIHQTIRQQFRPNDPSTNDAGGDLFRRLTAIYDGDLGQNTPEHRAIRNLLEGIRAADSVGDVTEAIKLTRMIFNMPSAIDRVLDNGVINLDHDYIKDRFKRDILVETKTGYLPSDANREKTNMLYRSSRSQLHQAVYNEIQSWLTPDANGEYRKLRTISIDDEGSLRDANGNDIENPLDSLARARVTLQADKDNNRIDQRTFNKNLKDIEDARKSILDGEMFLSKEAYLANLAMIGLHPDMVITNANNEVTGFKSGMIKPTISYTDVNYLDVNHADYGRVQEWFGKTAFKYNPFINDLLVQYGVDAITFKSANKINTLKERAGQSYNDKYIPLNPNSNDIINNNAQSMTWDSILRNQDNLAPDWGNKVVEIPLESMTLRGVSKEHDPLVGANTGVHMYHDNGIAAWTGLESKISMYQDGLSHMYTDVYYRTALAQMVMGARAEQGDPSVVNSAINSVLMRDGLVIEPWAQKRLEDNMISYYMNNGNIAGGVVPDGSLDGMTADMGDLGITIRSDINGRPTVQFFGEFLPSYYAAQKLFKYPGQETSTGVHNALIQEVSYWAISGANRKADGFIVNIDGKSFLQVEGTYIDKNGVLFNADTRKEITILPAQAKSANRTSFHRAKSRNDVGLRRLGFDPSNNLRGEGITLAEAALRLENEGLSIAMLNSRQPRNMMGDIVISKMAIRENSNGERLAHVDREAGNVSRMNYVDAIKPQDADFDFDKSFNFVAAPGLFWREANRLAGHISTESPDKTLNRLFDPNTTEGLFAKTLPDLISGKFSNDKIMYEVDGARGRFVKMHQTVTYLANIFQDNPIIATFKTDRFIEGKQRNLQVRLNNEGRYSTTVDNITELVKRFIDVNKRLPSEWSVNEISNIQDQILFGYEKDGRQVNGIFEVGYETQRKPGEFIHVGDYNLNQAEFRDARTTIRNRLINPINKYLTYNRGLEVDPTGMEQKASLTDYSQAYENLIKLSLDRTNTWGIEKNVDISNGLVASADYFKFSRNPYDIAMKGLHNVYKKGTILKEDGNLGKGRSEVQDIVDYIEGGFEPFAGQSEEAVRNRIFNKALKHYVHDEGRILRLVDLRKQERSLKQKIAQEEKFLKDKEGNEIIKGLKERLDRVQEIKTTTEEALTYYFRDTQFDTPGEMPTTLPHAGYKKEGFTASRKPVVVIDKSGKIKEVILKGKTNRNFIGKSDKLVENGKRFQVTDGEQQHGLRVLFEAFGGQPMVEVENGRWDKLTAYETRNHINNDYKGIISKIIRAKNMMERDPRSGILPGGKRQNMAKYVQERERILYQSLFTDPYYAGNVLRQKAMIMRMLTPSISDKIVSVRSTNIEAQKQAVYDYLYMENSLSEPIMSLLAKISSGEYKGDKIFAKQVLDDINHLKNAAFISSKNPNIDIDLLTSRMFTEPASLEGMLTQEKFLSRDIFDQANIGDQNNKDAARVMMEYATGGGLIDPSILYKASMEMKKNGIAIDQQWGRIKYLTNEDGSVIESGIKSVLIPERDSLRRKDLGDRGGKKKNTRESVEDIVSCFTI